MADRELLNILKMGVSHWNELRNNHSSYLYLDLRNANLMGMDLKGVNFNDVQLEGAHLDGAVLNSASLQNVDLSGASLRQVELNDANLKGAKICNADAAHSHFLNVNLTGADLSLTNLRKSFISNSLLKGASLFRTALYQANIIESNLSGSNLNEANFTGANLYKTSLSQCRLIWTNFSYANFNEANFDRAILGHTIFGEADLKDSRGLNSCIHQGASIIDNQTIINSDELPFAFLEGCGIARKIIEKLSFLHDVQKYPTCFISFSSLDQLFSNKLYQDLQNFGVRCWFAPKDLEMGAKIRSSIDTEIERHDKLLLILSESSINSPWVEQEVEKALEKERFLREKYKREILVLFPIRIDDAIFNLSTQGWPNLIKNTRNIGNFMHWDDSVSYKKSLELLLQSLKRQIIAEPAN